MIIVYTLHLIDRAMDALVRRLGLESRLGAWVTYWSGRVVFWQLNYVERIERISGWEHVEVNAPSPLPYTLYVNGTVRHGFIGDER